MVFLCPPLQNMDRVYSLYQTFPEGRAAEADIPKNPYGREQPASPAHLSVCQRLRRVIEELVDTEKSYVKVSAAVRLKITHSHIFVLILMILLVVTC